MACCSAADLLLVARLLQVGNGTWKGELATNQHSPFADPLVRPLFAGTEATSGFSGTFSEEGAEVFGTVLVAGHRSLGFRASLKWLAGGVRRVRKFLTEACSDRDNPIG